MKISAKFAAAALAGILAISSAAATTAPPKKRAAKNRKPQKPAVEQPAPRQLLPYELPPTPPQVTYRGGQLSILAENSTLSDVLQAVGKATGARVEGPMSGERVSAKLGPGAPRDVLADLLAGSSFNYVMVGSPASPAAVTSVTLTVRGRAPATSPGLSAAPARFKAAPVAAEVEPEEEEPEPQVEPAAEQPAPEPVPPQPGAPTGQPEAAPQQPKTPQQLLQELQDRLRKQQEEQQENQQTQPDEQKQ